MSGGCGRVNWRLVGVDEVVVHSHHNRVITGFQWKVQWRRVLGSHIIQIFWLHSIERKSTLKTSFQGCYSPHKAHTHYDWLLKKKQSMNCHSFEWRGEMWGRFLIRYPFTFFFSSIWFMNTFSLCHEGRRNVSEVYDHISFLHFKEIMIHGYISHYAMALTSNEWMNEWYIFTELMRWHY